MVALIVTDEEIARMQARYDAARRDRNEAESLAMLARMDLAGAHQDHDFARYHDAKARYLRHLDNARDATNEMTVWSRKIDAALNG